MVRGIIGRRALRASSRIIFAASESTPMITRTLSFLANINHIIGFERRAEVSGQWQGHISISSEHSKAISLQKNGIKVMSPQDYDAFELRRLCGL